MVFLFDEQYLALAGDTLSLERKVKEKDERIEKLEAENMQLRQFCEEFNALDIAEENRRLKKVERKKSKLVNENYKLKELLKECNLLLIKQQANDEVEHKESAELVLRIDEALK